MCCACEEHLEFTNPSPSENYELLEAEVLTIAEAKRRHRTFPEKLQKRYMGFFCKRGANHRSAVEVHFLFSRFRDVDFKPRRGYDSYQVYRIHIVLLQNMSCGCVVCYCLRSVVVPGPPQTYGVPARSLFQDRRL